MFSTIETLLTKYVDSFKSKNPIVFGVVALVLMGVSFVVTNGQSLGLFAETELTSQLVIWTNSILDLLMVSIGAHTVKRLSEKETPPGNPVTAE